MDRKGWTMRWVDTKSGFQRREVFTSPEGVEYIKTPNAELAEVTITEWRTPGLGPLYLKRKDSTTAHLRAKPVAKQEPQQGGNDAAQLHADVPDDAAAVAAGPGGSTAEASAEVGNL